MLRHAFASPKLAALARRLKLPRYAAVGVLEHLWYFTATQAPRGDVGRWTDEEIAAGIDWDGDPSELVAALIATRWLDACPKHRALVHDWADHCDQTVKRSPQVKMQGFAQLHTSDSLASDASAAPEPEHLTSGSPDSLSLSPEPEPEPVSCASAASEQPAAAAPPPSDKVSKKLRARPAPDRMALEEIQALEQWTRENLPSELPNVRTHIDACLDHFRANGKLMSDWVATCRNWIRRAPEMRRAPARGAPAAPAVKRKHTPEEIDAAARQWREEREERIARALRP